MTTHLYSNSLGVARLADRAVEDVLELSLQACSAAADESMARFFDGEQRDPRRAAARAFEAYVAVEQRLCTALEAQTPDWGIVSPRRSVRMNGWAVWVVEPLADLASFAAGRSMFGTMIALEIDGRPVLGLIHAPALAKTWWAVRDLGAYTGTGLDRSTTPWKRISSSPTRSLREAFICHHGRLGLRGDTPERLDALLQTVRRDRTMDGLWAHMLVAEGKTDAAIDLDASPFELPAFRLIVEESGGRVVCGEASHQPSDRMAIVSSNASLSTALAAWFTAA